MPTATKTKKRKSQVRSADPEAIRATVYFPPRLHAAMLRKVQSERKAARAGGGSSTGLSRVTLSATIVQACQAFVSRQPK